MSQLNRNETRKVSGYHRRGMHKLMTLIMVLMVINIALISVGLYGFFSRDKQTDYYAVTCNSEPVKLDSLGVAVVSRPQLLDWALTSAIAIYNFNYANWPQQVGLIRPLFSSQGWDAFYPSFKQSQIDPAIEKSTFVTAVATAAPVIERQGALNGIYRWRIAIPMMINYETASDNAQQSVVMRLIVSRVPSVQNPRGIAIVSVSVDGGS